MATVHDEYISFFKPEIGKEEIEEVTECLKSGWLTTAARSKRFEEDFASYMGAKHAVALNSCTAALHLALEAIGLQEGEIVIVPTMTFAATAEVVRYFKAIPVMVDCHEDDFCMDMEQAGVIVETISKGGTVPGLPAVHGPVKAIMPVHYAGQVADVIQCQKIAREHGLYIIEDCAHTCPAFYQNESGEWEKAGRSADIACYSFYANKTITTGEGGMALTDKQEWADRMRVMSLHGISKDAWKRFTKSGTWYYEITDPGFKYNLTDIAASIGIHQLKKANRFWERRKEIANFYKERLVGIPGVITPKEKQDRQHSWHLYVIKVLKEETGVGRNEFVDRLKEMNIGASVHYMPLHLHPYYVENFGLKADDFPVARRIFEQIISLPIYPSLSDAQLDRICCAIKKIATGK